MPFLSRHQIEDSIRTHGERKYREELRSALRNPVLTTEQRRFIKLKLEQVGQPKNYDAHSPPPPGAVDFRSH